MITEVVSFQVMLVHERLSTDCTNHAHPVLQRLLVNGVVVFLQRRLAAEVLAAAAESTSERSNFIFQIEQTNLTDVPLSKWSQTRGIY